MSASRTSPLSRHRVARLVALAMAASVVTAGCDRAAPVSSVEIAGLGRFATTYTDAQRDSINAYYLAATGSLAPDAVLYPSAGLIDAGAPADTAATEGVALAPSGARSLVDQLVASFDDLETNRGNWHFLAPHSPYHGLSTTSQDIYGIVHYDNFSYGHPHSGSQFIFNLYGRDAYEITFLSPVHFDGLYVGNPHPGASKTFWIEGWRNGVKIGESLRLDITQRTTGQVWLPSGFSDRVVDKIVFRRSNLVSGSWWVADDLTFRYASSNAAPSIEPIPLQTRYEGDLATLIVTAADPEGGALTFEWDMDNDGLYERSTGATPSTTWTVPDNQSYRGKVRVTDPQGAASTREFEIRGVNVVPDVKPINNVQVVLGETPPTYTFHALDQGLTEGQLTWSVNWGDGTPVQLTQTLWSTPNAPPATTSLGMLHTYAAPGVYTVTVGGSDKDGGAATPETFTVTVIQPNRPPVVAAGSNAQAGGYAWVEGSVLQFNGTASDPDNNLATVAWDFGDGTTGTGPTPTHTYADNGTYTAKITATDANGLSTTASVQVVITNLPPSATIGASGTLEEGKPQMITLANAADPGPADVGSLTFAFDCGQGYGAFGTAASGTCTPSDQGTFTYKAAIRDKDGATVEYEIVRTVVNVAPTATLAPLPPREEGEEFTLGLTGVSDQGAADRQAGFEYALDCGQGLGYGAWGAAAGMTCIALDNPGLTVGVKIRDKDGGVREYTGTISIGNVAPQLASFGLPADPVQKGTSLAIATAFFDPGPHDTHVGQVQWDLNTAWTSATVTGSGATKTVWANTSALGAGVYQVSLKVTDKDGGADTEAGAGYLVVYDPSAGFVTGGGWILSSAGDCQFMSTTCEAASGKANFGFVSRYQKGATVPTGETDFEFSAAGFRFKSTKYDWLVVSGARAQYKGQGTVNGVTGYGFLLTAIDAQVTGGGGVDKFRIKVWELGGLQRVVYDNQRGEREDSDAATALSGGSIVIHTGK